MKKLLAIAVAAALVAPAAAMADTTLYGKLHVSAGSVKDGDGANVKKRGAVESHSSRIGVKGATALDNGMEATYGVELGVQLDGDAENVSNGTANGLTTRNTFVGLKGNFGEVRVGKHDTPAKLATAGMDVFADTYGDMNRIIEADAIRAENVVAYINKFGPVGFAYAHSTDVGGQDRNYNMDYTTDRRFNTPLLTTTDDGTVKADSIMVNYSNGPFVAALGHTAAKATHPTIVGSEKAKMTNIGLGYKAEAGHKVNFIHETDKVTDAGGSEKAKSNLINGVYKIGNVDLKAQYGKTKVSGTDYSETLTSVGVDYNLGKKTAIYGLVSDNKEKSGGVKTNINKAAVVGLVTEF
ncbi:porin [Candidatus Thiothrix anitrata]|uniref:Porin n=1 Tax=Candidatus Thiothrix anitrata TaxID=2823902 RepID=A0ABX7X8T1_9GAMM|nr:porin [Candidatus Thiothrix anitrata]QTR51636.1 porin [Candidatus Thiothrix anitrata]